MCVSNYSCNITGYSAEPTWPTLMLAMIGKFAISCSNAILPVFTAELFPTVMRNLGVGSSNMSAGIALMLVPYLWNLVSFIVIDLCCSGTW